MFVVGKLKAQATKRKNLKVCYVYGPVDHVISEICACIVLQVEPGDEILIPLKSWRKYNVRNPYLRRELDTLFFRAHYENFENAEITRIAVFVASSRSRFQRGQYSLFQAGHMSVDEAMARCSCRRNPLRVHMPDKPKSDGFKVYCAVDYAAKCVWNFTVEDNNLSRIHFTPCEGGVSAERVLQLVRPLPGRNYVVFTDNYYSSVGLAVALRLSIWVSVAQFSGTDNRRFLTLFFSLFDLLLLVRGALIDSASIRQILLCKLGIWMVVNVPSLTRNTVGINRPGYRDATVQILQNTMPS